VILDLNFASSGISETRICKAIGASKFRTGDLEDHFCCLERFWIHTLRNIARISTIRLHVNPWRVILTIFSKMKDCSMSQEIQYTVNVVLSRKQCHIKSLLLQTTNGKWYMANRAEAILTTLSDLQSHSSTSSLIKCDFSYSCVLRLTTFQLA